MVKRLLLISNHEMIEPLEPEVDSNGLVIIGLDRSIQSQFRIVAHLWDIFRLDAVINHLPIAF